MSILRNAGLNDRLAKILADTDTGIDSDITAAKNSVNVSSVNNVTVTGTGVSGDEWGP